MCKFGCFGCHCVSVAAAATVDDVVVAAAAPWRGVVSLLQFAWQLPVCCLPFGQRQRFSLVLVFLCFSRVFVRFYFVVFRSVLFFLLLLLLLFLLENAFLIAQNAVFDSNDIIACERTKTIRKVPKKATTTTQAANGKTKTKGNQTKERTLQVQLKMC